MKTGDNHDSLMSEINVTPFVDVMLVLLIIFMVTAPMMMQGMGRMQHQDPAKMAESLFAKLDTSGKGYIEKADLQTAFQSVSTLSGASADDVFASLDGDSDGKVTQQEMSDSIRKLSDALESQFQSLRMNGLGGMGGGMGGGGMGMSSGQSMQTQNQNQNQYQKRHEYRNQNGEGSAQGTQTRTRTRDMSSNPTGQPIQQRDRIQLPDLGGN